MIMKILRVVKKKRQMNGEIEQEEYQEVSGDDMQ